MGGGKSSSSSNSTTENTTSTATSTGVVGDVLQGQNINITEYLTEDTLNVFKQLTALVGQSIESVETIATGAGELITQATEAASDANKRSLESTQAFAKQAVQPDVTVLTEGQKTLTYAVLAIAGVAAAYFIFKR